MQIKVVGRGVLAGLFLLGLASHAGAQLQEASVSRFFPGITGAGARAMGMGGAFIAIADDATAASWNPSGLAVLERPEVSVVGQPTAEAAITHPASTYTYHASSQLAGGYTGEATATTRYAPYAQSSPSRSLDFASVTFPTRFGSVKLVPQISYQRVVDLGSTGSYSSTGQGQEHVTVTCPASRCSASLDRAWQVVSGNATVADNGGIGVWAATLAASFTPKLYVGLALNRWGGHSSSGAATVSTYSFSADQRVNTTDSAGVAQDFSGTSVHFGVLVKPTSKISLGLVFRPAFDMTLDSVETFDHQKQSTMPDIAGESSTSTTTRNGTLRWPRTIGAGVAVMPTDVLTFSADFSATSWSQTTFTYAYGYQSQTSDAQGQAQSRVVAHADSLVVLWPAFYNPDAPDSRSPRQTDSSQVRVGVEYVVKNPRQLGLVVMPLRLGFIRDGQMTMNAPTPTKATYYGFTAGLGFVWKRISVDAAWVHMTGKSNYGFDSNATSANPPTNSDEHYRFDDQTAFASDRLFVSTVVRF